MKVIQHGHMTNAVPEALMYLREMERWAGFPAYTIELWERQKADTNIWWDALPRHGDLKYKGPYSYRAFCDHPTEKIVMLIDDTETVWSIIWVLLHEMTHAALNMNTFLREAMHREEQIEAEERFCDHIATLYVTVSYNLAWWRPRVQEKLSGMQEELVLSEDSKL